MAIGSLVDYESLPTENVVNPGRNTSKSDTHLKSGNGEGEKAWEAEQQQRDRLNEEGLGGLSPEEALKQALSEEGDEEDEKKQETMLWEKKERSTRKAPESQDEKEKEVSNALNRTMNFIEKNTAPRKETKTEKKTDTYMDDFYGSEREYSGDTNGISSEEKLRQIIEDYMESGIPPDGIPEKQLKILRKMRQKKLDREKRTNQWVEGHGPSGKKKPIRPRDNAHRGPTKVREVWGLDEEGEEKLVGRYTTKHNNRWKKGQKKIENVAWKKGRERSRLEEAQDPEPLHEPVETIIPTTIPKPEDNPTVYSSSQEDQKEEDYFYEDYLYREGNLTPEQQKQRDERQRQEDEEQEKMEISIRIQEQEEKKLNYNIPAKKFGDPQGPRHPRSGRRGEVQLRTGRGN